VSRVKGKGRSWKEVNLYSGVIREKKWFDREELKVEREKKNRKGRGRHGGFS